MPLDIILQHAQEQVVEEFTIFDDTGEYDSINNAGGYGAPNPERGQRANYLLVSKNDKFGTRTYLTVANTTPLATLIWSLLSTVDGWHQATLLSFHIWDSGQGYFVNDVQYYETTDTYYVCILDNTNIPPDDGAGSTYWTPITDFVAAQQGYTNLDVVDHEFLIEARTSVAIADALYDLIEEDFACKLSIVDAAHPLNLIAMLEGAEAKMIDDKGDQAQEIMTAIAACVD